MVHRERLVIVSTLSLIFLTGCASGFAPHKSLRSSPSATAASTPSLAGTTPAASRASAARFITDLTWVGDLTGWALSAVVCGSGLCPELASTTDGGKTWQQLPNPPASIQNGTVNCANVACISHVRFASTSFGYLYGPALLVTSNAGRSWRPEQNSPGRSP